VRAETSRVESLGSGAYTFRVSRDVPPWVGAIDDSDTDVYAAMTPEERLRCFVEVCEVAHAILLERDDAAAVLERSEPMSPEAERRWLTLVREARLAREAR
jgi:hypothetical protein